jgi:hypothetical protein
MTVMEDEASKFDHKTEVEARLYESMYQLHVSKRYGQLDVIAESMEIFLVFVDDFPMGY